MTVQHLDRPTLNNTTYQPRRWKILQRTGVAFAVTLTIATLTAGMANLTKLTTVKEVPVPQPQETAKKPPDDRATPGSSHLEQHHIPTPAVEDPAEDRGGICRNFNHCDFDRRHGQFNEIDRGKRSASKTVPGANCQPTDDRATHLNRPTFINNYTHPGGGNPLGPGWH